MTLYLHALVMIGARDGNPRFVALMLRAVEATMLREELAIPGGHDLRSGETPARYMRRHGLHYSCPIDLIDMGAFDTSFEGPLPPISN